MPRPATAADTVGASFKLVIFMSQGHEIRRMEVVTMPTLIDAGKRLVRGTTAARRRRQGRT